MAAQSDKRARQLAGQTWRMPRRAAFSQIRGNEFAQVFRMECVQIEHAIDGQFFRFVTFAQTSREDCFSSVE